MKFGQSIFTPYKMGTVCDMTSEKNSILRYNRIPANQILEASVCVLNPDFSLLWEVFVLADNNRKGKAEVVQESDSDYVAYQKSVTWAR